MLSNGDPTTLSSQLSTDHLLALESQAHEETLSATSVELRHFALRFGKYRDAAELFGTLQSLVGW